ncbi:hypothetical protein [Paraburkholderia fynbosensis]|uniref:Outer membrane protein beta-barrel domain-containing protein n=1 Tax=Paraburkholderia fynbosensis TaxID=1200993 RepID=A0A6J5H302_9BURK|nr:hypothetical protein [Paraburkholderia fynbosensis]CAB3809624.1 hypothetical protein LMG27177_06855 [Paraburkholderia fynbosensis]
MNRSANGLAALLIAVCSTPSLADDPGSAETDAHWQFALAPYLWLPSVSGTLRFTLPRGGADASTGPYNYLQNLRFALMLQGEARKGDWSIFGDTIYLNFGRHEGSVNAFNGALGSGETQRSVETSLSGGLVEVGGGRTVLRQPWGNVDAIVGMRYLGIKATLDVLYSASVEGGPSVNPNVHASEVQNIFNGFAGVRGRLLLSGDGRWYVPYYLDVGTGSSRFTWQALAGVGYAARWGDVSLTYRYLAFYGSGDQLVQTLRFSGPSANITFRF